MSFSCHRFDQNSKKNIIRISALKFFVVSFGLPGSFWGLPYQWYHLLSLQEAPESHKKFKAEILIIFSLLFLSKWWHQRHFEISWLLGSHHKSLQAISIEIDTSINPKCDDFLLLSYQFCTSNCFCKNLTDLQKDKSNDNDLLSYVFWSNWRNNVSIWLKPTCIDSGKQ